MFDDNTAVLVIRQGKILYAVGTDIDLSTDKTTLHTLSRVKALGRSSQRTILEKILEKTPEEANSILDEIKQS